MRLSISIFLTTFLLILFIPTVSRATVPPDIETVRLMLTAPDNQDLSVFDQEPLADILIEIIENDPDTAMYHERVVTSALKWLGSMQAPQAVDVLIANLEDYPTTCLYWLGTYASTDAVEAIIPYLDDKDASIRYEAAAALTGLPDIEPNDEWTELISSTLDAIAQKLEIEKDEAVKDVLVEACNHLMELLPD